MAICLMGRRFFCCHDRAFAESSAGPLPCDFTSTCPQHSHFYRGRYKGIWSIGDPKEELNEGEELGREAFLQA